VADRVIAATIAAEESASGAGQPHSQARGEAGSHTGARDFGAAGCPWYPVRSPSLMMIPLDRIAYVQFADALAPASSDGVSTRP